MTIALNLPLPPSVNGLYRNAGGGGRVLTKDYRAWIKAADGAIQLQKQGQKRISGNFIAHIILDEAKRRGDIDNRAKAVLDRLGGWDLTDDDKHCDRVTIEWGQIDMDVEHVPSECRVYVWAAQGEPMK